MLIKKGYILGVKGLETVGSRFGGKLYGMSQILEQSPEVDHQLKIIECELNLGAKLNPYQTLFIITLSTGLAIDGLNRKSELLHEFQKTKVNDELNKKYTDL